MDNHPDPLTSANLARQRFDALCAYRDNPITQEILRSLKEREQQNITAIIELPLVDNATIYTREQCIGEIPGLRQFNRILTDLIDEAQEQLDKYGRDRDTDPESRREPIRRDDDGC